MKKFLTIIVITVMFSCGTKKNVNINALYEVLTQQTSGGASIQFYEILSEEKEISMLMNDENLKNKINKEDIQKSNFVILNMGEKTSGGYKIKIENVEETASNIVVTVKQITPKANDMTSSVLTNPYTVLKINSKKEIIFK